MNSEFRIPDSESRPPLYGLVLAGGRSTRMGEDKSALRYHGKTQAEHCFELAAGFCAQVFISNRSEQASGHRGMAQIHDALAIAGPLNGILSAMHEHPAAAWLVLACDMPFVDRNLLGKLVAQRDASRMATAFIGSNGEPEPLCAIYEPRCKAPLQAAAARGRFSVREALKKEELRLIHPEEPRLLASINSQMERDAGIAAAADGKK